MTEHGGLIDKRELRIEAAYAELRQWGPIDAWGGTDWLEMAEDALDAADAACPVVPLERALQAEEALRHLLKEAEIMNAQLHDNFCVPGEHLDCGPEALKFARRLLESGFA